MKSKRWRAQHSPRFRQALCASAAAWILALPTTAMVDEYRGPSRPYQISSSPQLLPGSRYGQKRGSVASTPYQPLYSQTGNARSPYHSENYAERAAASAYAQGYATAPMQTPVSVAAKPNVQYAGAAKTQPSWASGYLANGYLEYNLLPASPASTQMAQTTSAPQAFPENGAAPAAREDGKVLYVENRERITEQVADHRVRYVPPAAPGSAPFAETAQNATGTPSYVVANASDTLQSRIETGNYSLDASAYTQLTPAAGTPSSVPTATLAAAPPAQALPAAPPVEPLKNLPSAPAAKNDDPALMALPSLKDLPEKEQAAAKPAQAETLQPTKPVTTQETVKETAPASLPAPTVTTTVTTTQEKTAPVATLPAPLPTEVKSLTDNAPKTMIAPSGPETLRETSPVMRYVKQPASSPVPPGPALEGEDKLSPQTKAVLAKIPSKLDAPKPVAIKQTVKLDRQAVEPDIFGDFSANSPVGIHIEVKKPRVDLNTELERAYDALLAGQQAQAIDIYKSVLSTDPKNKMALFGVATTLHRAGALEQARPFYSRLLAIDPYHREALSNFLALASEEAPAEALERLKALEVQNPDFSPIPAQIAMIYEKNGYFDAAIEYMRKAVKLAPENVSYRYNLAILYDKARQWMPASSLYQEIIAAAGRGETIPGDVGAIQERLTFLRSNT